MATTIIRLTDTHAGNSAGFPEKSEFDDGESASVKFDGGLQPLYRNQGSHDGEDLGEIQAVRMVVDVFGLDIGVGDEYYLVSLWDGVEIKSELLSLVTGDQSFDITADRSWVWSDFADVKLELGVAVNNGDTTTKMSVDQIRFEVDFEDPAIIVVDEVMEIFEKIYENAIIIRPGIIVDEDVEIEEEIISDIKMIIVSEDDVEIEESVDDIEGEIRVIDDDLEIEESVDTIEGHALIINDTIEITEEAVRALHSFFSTPVGQPESPRAEPNVNVKTADVIDVEILDGRRRVVVKKVPFENASFIDQKTIVGMDNDLRRLNAIVKALNDKLNKKK